MPEPLFVANGLTKVRPYVSRAPSGAAMINTAKRIAAVLALAFYICISVVIPVSAKQDFLSVPVIRENGYVTRFRQMFVFENIDVSHSGIQIELFLFVGMNRPGIAGGLLS
jgi:hypothetical protein